MLPAPLPASDEHGRLQILRELRILDTDPEPAFDAVVRLLQQQLGRPMAAIALVDEERVWVKASVGLPSHTTARHLSFCALTIADDAVFEVPDALLDPRFTDNPLVRDEPRVRSYAGHPLTVEGHRVGTVCVLDTAPGPVDAAGHEALRHFAEVFCIHAGVLAIRLLVTI